MRGLKSILTPLACFLSIIVVACTSKTSEGHHERAIKDVTERDCPVPTSIPIFISGGEFVMGQEEIYAEEGPEHIEFVGKFWMDSHEVTNQQFALFVNDTGYITVAERPVDPETLGIPPENIPPSMLLPGSAVFKTPETTPEHFKDWWEYVPGASWRKPHGPNGPDMKSNDPVVHLAWDDMKAYANWKGGRIPTEAEWEYAAKANSGNYHTQPSPDLANSWQGVFPIKNDATDGFRGIAPVACFEPNSFGLYDMIGNVWEVTADYYTNSHNNEEMVHSRSPSENTTYDVIDSQFPTRVMKGGSYLCAPNYCQRYRPAARQGQDPGLGASNVGFRLVYDQFPVD